MGARALRCLGKNIGPATRPATAYRPSRPGGYPRGGTGGLHLLGSGNFQRASLGLGITNGSSEKRRPGDLTHCAGVHFPRNIFDVTFPSTLYHIYNPATSAPSSR